MRKIYNILPIIFMISLSLVGCSSKKEVVKVDFESTKPVSTEEQTKDELNEGIEEVIEETEETEQKEDVNKDKETMQELTSKVKHKSDLGNVKTPFTAEDIKLYAEFKEKTSEGYIVSGKATNNSTVPLKSILATIEFNEGEDIGYIDIYDTLMPDRSRVSETLSSVEIKSIDAVSAQVTWLNDKGEEMFTDVDFQLGTTTTN